MVACSVGRSKGAPLAPSTTIIKEARDPWESCESLRGIDQPVETTGGFDHPGPPAQEQGLPIGGCPIHRREHRNRGDPGGGRPVEGRAGEEPEAAAERGQAETDVESTQRLTRKLSWKSTNEAGCGLGYAHYIIVRSACRGSRRVRILRYSAA